MDNETTATAPTATAPTQPAAPVPHEITLEQFGIELSSRDNRVALVNGFMYVEKVARHFKDTESAYQARFTAFINAPA